ncbi:prepilin peptidase [Streptomyces sp. NPDC057877]|uniref:prepilin peptidase n=1 Tax=Streptomyces sp. NPDC057877 TaxID=3346269 RepID=UPI0036946448
MRALIVLVAALWGGGAGLLLPRAAHRFSVAAGEPWSERCPGGHRITGAFGGWVGRARCVETGCAPYGPSAALVATLTAVVCAVLGAATGARPEVVVWLAVAPFAVLLALVDQRVQRLPDVLTLPLAAGILVLLGAAAALPADGGSWGMAVLGALVLGAGYLVLFLVNPSGMGFGDVKLALGLGAALGWYGWSVLFTGALAGLAYGALYGLSLIALRRASRKSAIPLGPFMIGGAFTGVVLGGMAAYG